MMFTEFRIALALCPDSVFIHFVCLVRNEKEAPVVLSGRSTGFLGLELWLCEASLDYTFALAVNHIFFVFSLTKPVQLIKKWV